MIIEKVKNIIKKHNLIKENDIIVVGVSGGPDSMCLLNILNELKEELKIKIYAAHLNHQIRGIEAQKDSMYVAKMCDAMGIVCFIKSIDVPKYCKENKLSLEEGARFLRYDMFFEIKEKVKGTKIAIAHNMNDQAETVLMRMMRGSGIEGLKGIDYMRDDTIIRPILDITREEIEDYCDKNNLNPRIDQTNLEDIYTRNKIRLKLIPYMSENFNPNLKESIVRMANLLRLDLDYIQERVDDVYSTLIIDSCETSITLDLNKCSNIHRAILNRVLRKSINELLKDLKGIEQKHIEEIVSIMNSKNDTRIDIPRGIIIYKKRDTIIIASEEIVAEKIEYNYKIPKNGIIKVKELNAIVESKILDIKDVDYLKNEDNVKYFDLDKIHGDIIIRSRQNGDKIKLIGLGGSKKIKDLFIDLKVPKEDRNTIPLICDEEEILWVVGYRLAQGYKLGESTKNVLKISYKQL